MKDKAGNWLLPQSNVQTQGYFSLKNSRDDIENLVDQHQKIQKEHSNLQKKYETIVNDYAKACEIIETLENKIKH